MSEQKAVRTAIWLRLSSDAPLLALATGGVHDHVPQGTAKPYVVMWREPTTVPDDTHSNVGHNMTTTIHGWSEAEGDDEVDLIMARVYALLNKQPLTVVGWTAWSVEREFATVLVEGDGDRAVRHGVARYRIQLHG